MVSMEPCGNLCSWDTCISCSASPYFMQHILVFFISGTVSHFILFLSVTPALPLSTRWVTFGRKHYQKAWISLVPSIVVIWAIDLRCSHGRGTEMWQGALKWLCWSIAKSRACFSEFSEEDLLQGSQYSDPGYKIWTNLYHGGGSRMKRVDHREIWLRFSYWISPIPRCTFFHTLITSENGMCLTNKGMPSLIGSVCLILAKHKKHSLSYNQWHLRTIELRIWWGRLGVTPTPC